LQDPRRPEANQSAKAAAHPDIVSGTDGGLAKWLRDRNQFPGEEGPRGRLLDLVVRNTLSRGRKESECRGAGRERKMSLPFVAWKRETMSRQSTPASSTYFS
jgi:hypothetical protein